ncbi:MAG: cupredoxin domain-containing protein [Rhodocyclaceae bacterium]|nr:cupredoxin domain-containing protein [Rhodocyclaceae bacterium]
MKSTLSAVLATALAGFAFAPIPSTAAEAYIENADEIVKQADWNAMETVTVVFEEHGYTPDVIRFKAGTPYKLALHNRADKNHYFTAPEFFRSIATRKAMVDGQAEIKAPYFKAIEVLKEGGKIDLYFVPVERGSFEVYCTIDDHRENGMEGQIVVE